MIKTHEIYRRLLLLGILVAVSGCGSSGPGTESGAVTIRLTHGGEPVTGVSVQLVVPGEDKGAFGDVDEQGSVSFREVATGEYTVVVVPAADPLPDPEQPPAPSPASIEVPGKFSDQMTSPLRANVTTGTNAFEFDLAE